MITEFQQQIHLERPFETRKPSLRAASEIASEKLGWSLKSTVKNILPMLTHWVLTHSTNANEKQEIVPQR